LYKNMTTLYPIINLV